MATAPGFWDFDPALANLGAENWVDYSVMATDGEIGRVSGTSMEAEKGCIIVETGALMFGKQRMIPASQVTSVDDEAQVVYVSLTKDQVKHAPDYDERHDAAHEVFQDADTYYRSHVTGH